MPHHQLELAVRCHDVLAGCRHRSPSSTHPLTTHRSPSTIAPTDHFLGAFTHHSLP
ncbi:hypothetical protein [Thermocoleostomius sinensis]|uniref:Uncharacterized protein n=1 Tax=Thermocoleostomius sinensis A174 TaxID=2016057 RepID=A0A9E8ZEQ4_9CYAN|nr:hypothetical protein [Thermocoleostomius sinensis]WAL61798.1 hypothetical protein OXH18_07390 [Thermocoleostomius sinensis A174]